MSVASEVSDLRVLARLDPYRWRPSLRWVEEQIAMTHPLESTDRRAKAMELLGTASSCVERVRALLIGDPCSHPGSAEWASDAARRALADLWKMAHGERVLEGGMVWKV